MRYRPLLSYPIASLLIPCLIVLISATGCESPATDSQVDPQVDQGKPPEPIAPKVTKSENTPEDAPVTVTVNAPKAVPKAAPKDGGKTVKAQPFAGKIKRKSEGVITTPINAYFSTKHRLVFLQIQDGLEKFQAIKGRKPKDFAEVKKEVIQPRALRLPELEPGDKFIYDPDEGPYGEVKIVKAG